MTTEAPTTTALANRPTVQHVCAECGDTFNAAPDARFCCNAHRTAYHNRAMKRGKVAMPMVLAWRAGKGLGAAVTDEQLAKAKAAVAAAETPEAKGNARQQLTRLRQRKDHRNTSAWAFRELCALADMWLAEDKAAGRQPALDYMAPKARMGWRAMDLNS